MFGVTTKWGTVLKDYNIRKVENHCLMMVLLNVTDLGTTGSLIEKLVGPLIVQSGKWDVEKERYLSDGIEQIKSAILITYFPVL